VASPRCSGGGPPPRRLALGLGAYLRATEWRTASAADRKLFQAPFRAGIGAAADWRKESALECRRVRHRGIAGPQRPAAWCWMAFRDRQGRLAPPCRHGVTASSAQGDLSSGRELRYIMYFLDDNKILHEPKQLSDDSLNMKKEFDYYQKISDSPIKARSLIYIITFGAIESRYTKVYGELGSHQVITPRYIDLDVCKPYMKRLRRASRTGAPETKAVGYGQPPIATRWSPGQSGNPLGRRRQEDDGFNAFRDALGNTITVVKDGKKTSLASGEVITIRLFESAIKGTATAQKQLRKLIIELHERGLLCPPKTPPRRRRVSAARIMSDHARSVWNKFIYANARILRQEMAASFEKLYGPIAEFESNLERRYRDMLPDTEGLETLNWQGVR